MRKRGSINSMLPSEDKLKKFVVSFDIVLRKPVSERFSGIDSGQVVHKRGCFYAMNLSDLQWKVSSTYSCSGRVCNLDILNPSIPS